ncbi:MAG: hypothetical protein ACREM2_01390 [Vulcanimicrobiaceae bacterium]
MGLYQGLNPPMGWLLAAGRALQQRSARPLIGTVAALAFGHYLAMLSVLVPVALLLAWSTRHPELPFASLYLQPGLLLSFVGVVLAGFGVYKLMRPRHPILLARVHPNRRVRWSFLMAHLHCGSPVMMLAPFLALAAHYATPMSGASASAFLLPLAVLVPAVMVLTLALVAGGVALVVWRFLGLGALTRVWLNFDLGWAVVFLLMATMALTMGQGHMRMAL